MTSPASQVPPGLGSTQDEEIENLHDVRSWRPSSFPPSVSPLPESPGGEGRTRAVGSPAITARILVCYANWLSFPGLSRLIRWRGTACLFFPADYTPVAENRCPNGRTPWPEY